MSNYTKLTNFTVKDSLPSGNTAKIIKGTEIDNEFSAIAAAVSTKVDAESGMFNNGTLAGTTAVTGTLNISATTTVTGALSATTFSSANATITGGFVDNTPIGSVTPSTGSFTTLSGNGASLTNLNAANIATGIIGNARTTATFNATANTIVLRGALGGFSANLVNVTGLTSTGTVNTPAVNGDTTLRLQTGGVDRVTVDAAGNAGLGVVPPIIAGNRRALLIGNTTVASVYHYAGIGESAYNWHLDGGSVSRYATTNPAGTFEFNNSAVGGFAWKIAPSGTAGAPITFTQAMTLTQGGDWGLGTASPASIGASITTAHVSGAAGGAVRLSRTAATTTEAFIASIDNEFRIAAVTSNPLTMLTGNTERARITSGGNFRPGADNAYSLGEPSFRWSVVYAATGTINTSDERAKLDFAPTLGLDFIAALEPVSYRYKNGKTVIEQVEDGTDEVPAVLDEDGNEVTPATTKPKYKSVERVIEGTRRHHGLKAQQVKSVLDAFGADFAGWVLENPDDPNSGQGLRYDQFISPLIKAVQELSAQNAALTDRIAALESLNKPQE